MFFLIAFDCVFSSITLLCKSQLSNQNIEFSCGVQDSDSKSDTHTKLEGREKNKRKSDWNIKHFHGTSINSIRRYSQFSRGFLMKIRPTITNLFICFRISPNIYWLECNENILKSFLIQFHCVRIKGFDIAWKPVVHAPWIIVRSD